MRSPGARWNHPKAVEKTVPWKPWKTKPRFPTAPTAPWKTRNLGEFPTFPPPCDSLFPSLKKTKGQEGSMKQADRSPVNKSGQIQKLPTDRRSVRLLHATLLTFGFLERGEKGVARRWESGKLAEVASFPRGGGSGGKPGFGFPRLPRHRLFHGLWVVPAGGRTPHSVPPHGDRSES